MVLRLKARESKSLPGQPKLVMNNRHLPLLIARLVRARQLLGGH